MTEGHKPTSFRTFFKSFSKYERHLSAGAVVLALIVDTLTFVRVDLFFTQLLLITYLLVVGTGIVLINLREEGGAQWISPTAYWWLFVAVQFSFGGLFGRFLIYYSRSGSIFASWPFLLILAVLLVGNEFAKKHYTRMTLQLSFFFLCIFSFLIFFIPLLLGKIGRPIFFLSGVISLLTIFLFLRLLRYLIPKRLRPNWRAIWISIGVIYLVVNALYFANVIPPIPLSLREAGVYHSVVRTAAGYRATKEEAPGFFSLYETIHLLPGEPVYLYSSVFAPTNFDAYVVHQWQYYDLQQKKWIDSSRIPFPIVGGQERGYRGYTLKTAPTAGFWRVDIETTQGQIIGRIEFKVDITEQEPELLVEDL